MLVLQKEIPWDMVWENDWARSIISSAIVGFMIFVALIAFVMICSYWVPDLKDKKARKKELAEKKQES